MAVRFPSDRIGRNLSRQQVVVWLRPVPTLPGRPSPTTAQHVEEDLGEAIEMIIDGGQVGIGLESTIVDFTEDVPVVLRPGYGFSGDASGDSGGCRMDKGADCG